MGRAWDVLMTRLGYSRYVAQGGDWGAFIVDLMGVQQLPGLLAIHTNYPGTVPAEIDAAAAASAPAPDGLSAEETRGKHSPRMRCVTTSGRRAFLGWLSVAA
jgi:hypothetical protein